MEETLKDVVEGSSPQGVPAGSPTAETVTTVAPSEATEKQAEQPKEPPFHEHPRWREVQMEKERAKLEAEYLRKQNEELLALAKGFQPKEPQVDPYANMTPEEKAFWEKTRELAREEARREVEAVKKQYDPYIERYEKESVMTVYDSWKEKHPEITQEDEMAMARIVKPLRQSGMTPKEALENAYRVVFFDKNAEKAAQQIKQQQVNRVQQKAAANMETTTTVQGSIPTKTKESLRDFARNKARELGL